MPPDRRNFLKGLLGVLGAGATIAAAPALAEPVIRKIWSMDDPPFPEGPTVLDKIDGPGHFDTFLVDDPVTEEQIKPWYDILNDFVENHDPGQFPVLDEYLVGESRLYPNLELYSMGRQLPAPMKPWIGPWKDKLWEQEHAEPYDALEVEDHAAPHNPFYTQGPAISAFMGPALSSEGNEWAKQWVDARGKNQLIADVSKELSENIASKWDKLIQASIEGNM